MNGGLWGKQFTKGVFFGNIYRWQIEDDITRALPSTLACILSQTHEGETVVITDELCLSPSSVHAKVCRCLR
jgi:hypothetical protein